MPCLVEISSEVLEKKILNFNVFSFILNYLPLGNGGTLYLNKLESPSPEDALCQVWLKFGQWFWRRRVFNFVNVFSLFCNYLALKKGGARHLNKIEFGVSGSGEEDFLILSMYFRYFVIISPLKRAGPFIWTKLNPIHPRMFCIKFSWNWPSGSGEEDFKFCQCIFNWCSGEEDFLNYVNLFSLFRNYLPLEKRGALHLIKLESP